MEYSIWVMRSWITQWVGNRSPLRALSWSSLAISADLVEFEPQRYWNYWEGCKATKPRPEKQEGKILVPRPTTNKLFATFFVRRRQWQRSGSRKISWVTVEYGIWVMRSWITQWVGSRCPMRALSCSSLAISADIEEFIPRQRWNHWEGCTIHQSRSQKQKGKTPASSYSEQTVQNFIYSTQAMTSLWLRENQLGDSGIQYLSDALMDNTVSSRHQPNERVIPLTECLFDRPCRVWTSVTLESLRKVHSTSCSLSKTKR